MLFVSGIRIWLVTFQKDDHRFDFFFPKKEYMQTLIDEKRRKQQAPQLSSSKQLFLPTDVVEENIAPQQIARVMVN
jgi:hypothetical protein